MAADIEGSAITARELSNVFELSKGLLGQAESLRAEAQSFDRERLEIMHELYFRARRSGLPDDAKLIAAALFRGAINPDKWQQDLDALARIDTRMRASRGQTLMWLDSREDIAIHSFKGNGYIPIHYLHFGVIDKRSVLEPGDLGEVVVPLGIETRVRVARGLGRASLGVSLEAIRAYGSAELAEVQEPGLAIRADCQLDSFPLFIGDVEVEQALATAGDDTRDELTELRNRFASTLF